MKMVWNEWSETEREACRSWLKSILASEVVSITFTKVDGTKRVMKASLKEGVIPVLENKTTRTRTPNPDVISVVDTEIGEWRSIRFDSITELRFPVE